MSELREVLEDARRLLNDPERPLVAGAPAPHGGSYFSAATEPCHCSATALTEAFGRARRDRHAGILDWTATERLEREVYEHFCTVNGISYFGPISVIRWNDAYGRTVDEVREAFDRAIETA